MMEQINVLEMDQEFDEFYCLPVSPEVQEQEAPQVFKLVVETANYRVEIEIG
jgi:hypothetical protein